MKTGHQSFTDLLIFTQWRDTLRMPAHTRESTGAQRRRDSDFFTGPVTAHTP